jgi:hypothetical protein
MTPVETDRYMVDTDIFEPFRQYAVTWPQIEVRTDTPDLLLLFREALVSHEEPEIDSGMDVENRAVYADLAEASFESLPAD